MTRRIPTAFLMLATFCASWFLAHLVSGAGQ